MTNARCILAGLACALALVSTAHGQSAVYRGEGDAIRTPLTVEPGRPERGRAIVQSRTLGNCLLCHAAPLPEERFQGDIGPDLRGVGARLSPGQIRLRVVDATRLNPDTPMPAYHRLDGLKRVAAAFAGKPVLSAQEVEDVVAFLAGLKD